MRTNKGAPVGERNSAGGELKGQPVSASAMVVLAPEPQKLSKVDKNIRGRRRR